MAITGCLGYSRKATLPPKASKKKILPRFNPDSKESAKNHIQKFFLANLLMSVQAEDVFCRLFLYKFEGNTSMWYFSLLEGSITGWNEF